MEEKDGRTDGSAHETVHEIEHPEKKSMDTVNSTETGKDDGTFAEAPLEITDPYMPSLPWRRFAGPGGP